jgi:2-keto-4-pentenoate hydratase/2-oxohepta-3-ene-1,7-dioic acid hydratase in catechol pathway
MVTNDVSARDIQLSQTQFYEGKSYPTFTPVGPALALLDADELKRFTDLRLRLWVGCELRQDMTAADMIYQPVEALRALARFQRLDPGDLVLTGTPGSACGARTRSP